MNRAGVLILNLHEEAMERVDDADLARKRGEDAVYREHLRVAYELESKAARLIESEESEPTRSILHRSAASLAFRCGDYDAAERLFCRAMLGKPPEDMKDELREVYDYVRFSRQLAGNGVWLDEDQILLSLQGDLVGPSSLSPAPVFERIKVLERILQRTVSRLNSMSFTANVPKSISAQYKLFVAGLSDDSARIRLKIGRPLEPLLQGLGKFDDIFNGVLDHFALLGNAEYETLQQRLPEPAYYRNFVGLAKRIAPDGKSVSSVGLQARVGSGMRTITLDTNQSEMSSIPMPIDDNVEQPLELKDEKREQDGVIKFANALSDNQVKLVAENNTTWTITVPQGLMRDVVQEYFDESVRITGQPIKHKRRHLYLNHIEPA